MALKGLDIFKLTPKKNCKQCGSPTCMAFSMKVAQGSIGIEKCPFMSADAIAKLSEATAPPMKTLKIGDYDLGGETVLYRHEKTFVNRPRYAVGVCSCQSDEAVDAALASVPAIDYERIGERMQVEYLFVNYAPDAGEEKYLSLVAKAAALGRGVILSCGDPAVAEKAVAAASGKAVLLNGANAENFEAMSAIATKNSLILGVSEKDLDAAYDVVQKLEAAGNKNLVVDCGGASVKEAFANAVALRRGAISGGDRSLGYPSLVCANKLAPGDVYMQTALASLFTEKYGSIIVLESLSMAQALPLYGLRQNIFTDPQKPMRVEPGIYPINGADENSPCATTVDFALTYFLVSGELERSGVPVNLLISDAGGYSVLTSWAAGKFSAGSISKFITEQGIADKIKNRTLIIPGKVAVLKGELEERLPDWKIVIAPKEATGLVKFMKEIV